MAEPQLPTGGLRGFRPLGTSIPSNPKAYRPAPIWKAPPLKVAKMESYGKAKHLRTNL